MDNKLFVGNLSWNVKDEDLKAFFEQAGTVEEAKVIIDRQRNRSKGFGFVTMATAEEAQAAMDKLNGVELDGRAVKVSIALPPKQRDNGGFQG